MGFKDFFKDFFSKSSSSEMERFKSFLRFSILLALIFAFVFGVSLVYIMRSNPIHQLIDLKGRDVLYALKEIQDKNFQVKIFEKIDVNTPKYKIISQDPAPGEMVKEGRTISLVVSAGDQFITMPNFISNSYQDVRKNIISLFAGFKTMPNIIKVERYSSYQEGLVVDQFPKEGENLNYNQEMKLVVSQGLVDEAILIGDYRGKSFRKVEKFLLDQGLKITTKYSLTAKSRLSGRIFKQDVTPKTILVPGEEIKLEVGVYSKNESHSSTVEVLRLYTLQVPFRATDFEENQADLEEIRRSFSIIFNKDQTNQKPHSEDMMVELMKSEEALRKLEIPIRKVRLEVDDKLGENVALEEEIPPGYLVDLPYKTIGEGILSIYLDDELYEEVEFGLD